MISYPLEDLSEFLEGIITPTNRPVYDPSQYNTTPHCIYFYYVTFTRLDEPDVKVYYYDHRAIILRTELDDLVEMLTLNARRNDDVPPKCGTIFEAVHWRRKSYFVLVIDDENKRLKDDSAIVFDVAGGSAPNYTFLDGEDIPINVQNLQNGVDTLWALCCINHMKKDSNGNDLGLGERQHFIYRIILQDARSPLAFFVAEIDPGGTNLGPPVGPP